MEKICFVLPKLYQPRYLKRVSEAKSKGYDVKILFFERFNNKDIDINELKGISTQKIAEIDNTIKLSRVAAYFKLISLFIKNRQEYSNTTFYIFTLDLLFLVAVFFKLGNVIYEVGDIIYLEFNSTIRKFFLKLETFLMSKCKKVVLTSDGFRKYYRRKGYSSKNLLIIPNKVPQKIIKSVHVNKKNINSDKIIIGYIGIFRYKKYLFRFIEVIGGNSNFEMKFYGYSNFMSDLEEYTKKYSNINYYGKFSTEDLPKIYNSIDISYCVYKKGINEKIAEPNKFYESIFFETPILCQKNTLVGDKVSRLNTGFTLDISHEIEISKFANDINRDIIEEKIQSIKKIPQNYSCDTGEVFL